ncbi:MAG: hypothetical protein JWM28_793 [Chitinophagaceae bacterium]|nr:hypothetical protein [Chitinophagaceae bacterium]
MEQDKKHESKDSDEGGWNKLRDELENLDKEYVEMDGVRLKPSQCYRIANSSLHVIYNTNCPDSLKEKIQSILSKYTGQDESNPPEQEFFFP